MSVALPREWLYRPPSAAMTPPLLADPGSSPPFQQGLLLTVAYDGARYSGFAPQENAHTVGEALRGAVLEMDPHASALRVTSRTDAGVHARGQVVCFDTTRGISPRGWLLGLSAFLPIQIAVLRVAQVQVGFNPSRAATRKTYRYRLLRGTLRDPFLEGRSWRVHARLDLERMRQEASLLIGTHDFRAFRGASDFRKNTVRTIEAAGFVPCADNERCLVFEITGNRFLYRMVRIIVGTLVDVGRGAKAPGAVPRAIASGNRLDLGVTAPPDGLVLERIELSELGENGWPDHW